MIGIDTFKWWNPVFVDGHDQVPAAGNDVKVHHKEENDLGQLHHQLDVLLHVHPFYNSPKSRHPNQFQQTEQRENFRLLLRYHESYAVEWDSSQQVN